MRFFRTPKGLLLIVLVALAAIAAPTEGVRVVLPGLFAAVAASAAIDALILRARSGKWELPSGAILTALIVAMVLTSREPWWVVVVTSVAGVVTKYVFRAGGANIFNPAALALVAAYYAFGTGQSWWGALPELPLPAIAALAIGGVFIADRVNKIPTVLAYLAVFYSAATIAAFAGLADRVAEVFRTPDLHAAIYFACFIATDPPTSPVRHRDQVIYGAIAAIVAVAVYLGIGAAYYMLAGVLAANLWEATRRYQVRRARTTTRRLATAG